MCTRRERNQFRGRFGLKLLYFFKATIYKYKIQDQAEDIREALRIKSASEFLMRVQ